MIEPIYETGLDRRPRSFHIKTFGCQMNEADTHQMSALLSESGLKPESKLEQADVILVNGCSVREKAVHKAVSALGTFQKLKQASSTRYPIIGLGGCVGQLDRGEIFNRLPFIDFVFGPDAIDEIPEIVYRAVNGERHQVFTEFDAAQKYSTETKVLHHSTRAYVNIMKGCDKYCSYCIVPFTRGREKSREIDEVLHDIAALTKKGVQEITLLGQNVNSFGKGNLNTKNRFPFELRNPIGKVGPKPGEENFPQLLRAIDQSLECKDIRRIRFTSSHPLDFSDELIECYDSKNGVKKLARHLHLPVQSGSNRILRKMGRHHQIETYISQMDRLREICPDVGLSTDLIVGFPTETFEEFEETLRLLDRIQFDSIYAFAYSPRPGTRAAKFEDDVSSIEKKKRLNKLLEHQKKISLGRYQKRIHQLLEVLVEGPSQNPRFDMFSEYKSNSKMWMGRTSCNRVVNFFSESPRNLSNHFVPVRILKATSLALYGKLEVLAK